MRLITLFVFSTLSFGWGIHAASSTCPEKVNKQMVSTVKSNRPHSYFTRCHPKLPLGFSNEIQTNGTTMTPVVINLETAEKKYLELSPGESAEDLTPTPDGKFLVAQIRGKNSLDALGLFKIDDNGRIERVGLLKSDEEKISQNYFYPSTAIRNNQYLVAVRTMYKKEGHKNVSDGIFINKIMIGNGKFKTESDTQICSNLEEFDRPYLSQDASFVGGAAKGEMGIYRIDWEKRQGREVPCTLVRKLPHTAGKVSFSPSNRLVVFHADELNFLGQTNPNKDSLTQTYLLNVQTGQMSKISEDRKGMGSEYPYFCQEGQVLMRSVRFGKNAGSVFDLANITIEPNQDCKQKLLDSNANPVKSQSRSNGANH